MKLSFVKERFFTGLSRTIVILVIACFVLTVMTVTKTNQGYKDGRDIDSLKAIHYRDSTIIIKLRTEASRMMAMMQKGADGRDTVYFMDKDKKKYMMLFIKK
jgi:hypothetical protein